MDLNHKNYVIRGVINKIDEYKTTWLFNVNGICISYFISTSLLAPYYKNMLLLLNAGLSLHFILHIDIIKYICNMIIQNSVLY